MSKTTGLKNSGLKTTGAEIIKALDQTGQGPLSLRRLMADLKIDKKAKRELKDLLRELVESGQIIRIKGGRYGLSRKMNLVPGYVKAHPAGYGFVIPEDESLADIFIPPDKMREVLDGDRVMARVDHVGRDGRRSGCIIRVLERAHKSVIGRVERTKHTCFVVPNNPFLTQDIIITKDNTSSEGWQSGQLVVVKILEYPTKHRNPTGQITGVLGWPDDPGTDVEVVIHDNQLPDVFPESVREEARALRPELTGADLEGRLDLRNLLTITIDGETARDFDDAISWQPLTGGAEEPKESGGPKESEGLEEPDRQEKPDRPDEAHGPDKPGAHGPDKPRGANIKERLWVHIADVSHYVLEGSALDEEAFLRGTSVYFPERAIPMLPQELSNELCSLKPRVDRLTLSVRMDFDARACLVDYEITPSVINSNERMTYTQVRDILKPPAGCACAEEYGYLEPAIRGMGDLAMRLRQNRLDCGSIDFDLPEPEIILNLRGGVESIIRAERNQAHNLIEEFMLVANRIVAEYMGRLQVPFIYRIHEEPEEADVFEFMELLRELGWEKGNQKPPVAKRLGKQFEKQFVKQPEKQLDRPKSTKSRLEHKDLQEILNHFKGKHEEAVVNYLLLRTMKRARYSTQNVGHFGLAIEDYTHFTSPIRRYPDLVVHRFLKQVLNGETEKLLQDRSLPENLATIANHSSLRERIAEEAERKIIDLKRTRYMQEKVGEEYAGIISGVTAFGFFVELEEIFVEGLVHIRNLGDDYYQFNERTHRLEGSRTGKVFRIGDQVMVRVAQVDLSRLHIDFTLKLKSS